MAFLHIISGEKEKAREHLDIALSIDPLSQETHFFNAYFQYMMEEYEDGLKKLETCLQYDPKNIAAHTIKCYCLLKLDRCDEVISYFETLPPAIVIQGDKLGLTTIAYAIKKDKANTEKCLSQLLEYANSPDGFRAHAYLFLTYVVAGEYDRAFEWIQQSIESKSSLLLFNFADPLVNEIKDDPRYAEFHKIIYQQELIIDTPPQKKELLGATAVADYTKRLLKYISEEKPYLNPELSLRLLADQIDIHPNQLSWLLNESIGKNFNEFINYYRVEAFKALCNDPKNVHITLMGLAYDSGFNSKTVFNTYFKKETGLTPKQFSKSLEI
jgi:AraC-like DNA-binding protein